jgi:hypothetical protein
MGTTMGNPECEWVRLRLPLWVDVSEDRTERNGEGGDLSPEDGRSIERHLGSCAGCNRHRVGLEKALGVLELAAGSLVVPPGAPSLWPALERRMTCHPARTRPRWLRTVHGIGERGLRGWFDFQGEQPLRLAWLRDSVGEALEGASLGEPTGRGRVARRHGARRTIWIIGTGMAAAVLVLSIGLTEARRQQGSAQSIIRVNAQSLPDSVPSPTPIVMETPAPGKSADAASNASSELAQGDPVPVPETPSAEPTPAPKAAPAPATVTATPAPAPSASPSRWNYDLEHGTPMPPHARDVKPVY